jgi:hypothetical protein
VTRNGAGALGTAIFADAWWVVEQVILLLWFIVQFMLFILGIRLIRRPSKADNYEGWGYIAWAVAAWAFAIPELYGTIAGHNGRVPTLSNTVGNLLNHRDYLSVVVVGLLFFGVLHVVRVQIPAALATAAAAEPATEAESGSPGESATDADSGPGNPPPDAFEVPAGASGRATDAPATEQLPVVMAYDVIALIAVGLAFLIPVLLASSKQVVGESGYGALGVALFFIPGMLAYRHKRLVPLPSLFTTILNLETHSRPVAILFGAGFVFLTIHLIFYPFPSIIPDIQGLHHHCSPPAGVPKPAICINP